MEPLQLNNLSQPLSQSPAAELSNPLLSHSFFSFQSWLGLFLILSITFILTFLVQRIADQIESRLFKRWIPMTHIAIWTSAALLLVFWYSNGLPFFAWFGIFLFFALMILFAFIDEIRAVVAGLSLSFEHNIKLGDTIRIGDIEGKVTIFRMRSVRLESVDGVVHDIPNSQFQREIVSNFSEHGEHSHCTIRFLLPPGINSDSAIKVARQACVLSPYSSLYIPPEVLISAANHDPQHLQLNIHAFAFNQSVRQRYQSDILTRLEKTLFQRTGATTKHTLEL